MTDSLPALHRAEGHGKLGELVHRLVEHAGPRGALTEAELRAELPSGFDAHLQSEVRARLAVQGVSIVPGPGANGDHGPVSLPAVAPTPAAAATAATAGNGPIDDGPPTSHHDSGVISVVIASIGRSMSVIPKSGSTSGRTS